MAIELSPFAQAAIESQATLKPVSQPSLASRFLTGAGSFLSGVAQATPSLVEAYRTVRGDDPGDPPTNWMLPNRMPPEQFGAATTEQRIAATPGPDTVIMGPGGGAAINPMYIAAGVGVLILALVLSKGK